jgi:radical SAM superfamily enzyme with C-terminal helix-hairpin-helix motif
MIARVLPEETVLKRVYLEIWRGKTTFGRQIGTYPILVGLPYRTELNRFVDVRVLSHGFRSVTGVESPLSVNDASMDALSSLPGIGRRRAARLVKARPIRTPSQLTSVLDDERLATDIARLLKFDSE